MNQLKEKIAAFLVLLVLIIATEVVLARWVKQDTRPLSWDESIHTKLAVEYQDRIQTEGVRAVLHPAYFHYPPLFHLALGPVLDWPSDIADAGAIVNGLFLAVLMLLIFILGLEFMGPWESALAAFMFSTFPVVVELSRPPMIDLMLTVWVTLGFFALVKSDGFSSLLWSVVFGVTAGLGMLTKWTFAGYLIGPVGWMLVLSIKRGTFRTALLSIGIGMLVACPWYLENFFPMLTHLRTVASDAPASGVELTGWRNIFWYVFHLGEAINIYYVLLLIPGLVVAFWRPRFSLVLVWLVAGLAVFTLIRNHNVRYAVPVLPAAALLSAAWLPSSRKWVLGVVALGCGGFFIFQHFLPHRTMAITLASVPVQFLANRPPLAEDWKHADIIRAVESRVPRDRFAKVAVLSNAGPFHSTTLNVSASQLGAANFEFDSPSRDRWLDFKDFVLYKSGDLGPGRSLAAIQPASDLVKNPPAWFTSTYKEVGRWPLPSNSEAVLYHADPAPIEKFKADGLQLSLKSFSLGKIQLEDFNLTVRTLSPADTAKGVFRDLRITARTITSKGLEFQNADLVIERPQINLARFLETGEIQLIRADAMSPKVSVDGALISAYAGKKLKGLKDPTIRFEGSEIRLEAKFHDVPLALAFSHHLQPNGLEIRLEEAKAGWLPLPKILFSGLINRTIPLTPNEEFPFRLNLGAVSGVGSTLRIGT